MPSWSTTGSLAAVQANEDLFSEASPFWYTARASGGSTTVSTTMSAATRANVVSSLQSRGIAVIPSVADGSSARAMASVLKSASARARHVAQLVALVDANGYDGIELDYEKFAFSDGASTWAATRPAWITFIAELARALHAGGHRLAVAVPPMYNGLRQGSSGYWVYDYAGMAPHVDSLRIMTYDYSVSRPGPIAPLSFLHRTLGYAVTAFPASRIRMGVPAYGRLWTARRADGSLSVSGTCPVGGLPSASSFTTDAASTYLASVAGGEPTYRWDAATGETVATFRKTYRGKKADGTSTSCTADHVAWFVDARGVAARMPLIEQYGLAGAAFWHLGGVDADSWAAVRAYAESVAPSPTSVRVSAPRSVLAGTPVTVSVQVTSAVAVEEGTAVRIQRRAYGSPTWRTVGTARTDAEGRASIEVPGLSTTTNWRARVEATAARLAGVDTDYTTVAPKVAVTASTRTPAPKQKVTFTVRVTPARTGLTVHRQMRVDGRWRTVATATSKAGRASFTFRWMSGDGSRTYRITTAKKAGLVAGASPTLTVTTR